METSCLVSAFLSDQIIKLSSHDVSLIVTLIQSVSFVLLFPFQLLVLFGVAVFQTSFGFVSLWSHRFFPLFILSYHDLEVQGLFHLFCLFMIVHIYIHRSLRDLPNVLRCTFPFRQTLVVFLCFQSFLTVFILCLVVVFGLFWVVL